MAELEFSLEYDGPAVEDHEMDAREFASAVLSAAELFQVMNEIVHPNDPPVTVNIRATDEGSFDVVLKLISDTGGFLVSAPIVAGINLKNLMDYFTGIIRFTRRKSHSELVSTVENGGMVTAIFRDGVSIQFPSQVLGLADNYRVRHSINDIVRPVDGEGIESVSIKQEEIVVERIDYADVQSLARSPRELPVALEDQGTNREVWLDVVSLTFKQGNAWRFSDGGPTFSARVTDESFLASIEDGETFGKGDRLKCVLHEVQWTDSGGKLKNRREIIQVLDHVRTVFQPRLDI